jgi:glycosyltransferase involved in cell wall biosynthesis
LERRLRPLRICLFTPEFPPGPVGGIGTHTRGLARSLVDRGHEVFVVVGGNKRQFRTQDGFTVIEVRKPRRFRLMAPIAFACVMSRALGSLERALDFDLIEAPEYGAATAFMRSKCPVIVRLQAGTAVVQRFRRCGFRTRIVARIASLVERLAIGRADYISSPSLAVAREESARLDALIPNAPLHGLMDGNVQRRPRHVVFLGRYERLKGPDVLARAARMVMERLPDARFTFAGVDTLDAPAGGSMRSYCEELLAGCAEGVEFRPAIGSVEVRTLLESAAVLAVPSQFEAFGVVFVEAMLAGAVPIGCIGTGAAEVIEHGRTGILVRAGDVARLAEELIGLLQDEPRRLAIAKRALAEAAGRFTSSAVAARYEQFYRSILPEE